MSSENEKLSQEVWGEETNASILQTVVSSVYIWRKNVIIFCAFNYTRNQYRE